MGTRPENTDLPFLTIDQLVDLGISRSSWYRLNREGKIQLRKCRGRTVILRSNLDAFLQTLPLVMADAA